MIQAPYKLFGLMITYYHDPKKNAMSPHTCAAIYDMDAKGKIIGFSSIDFSGFRVHRWENFPNGRYIREGELREFGTVEAGLFFPIRAETAALFKDTMDTLDQEIEAGRNPFYRGAPKGGGPTLKGERFGRKTIDFRGRPLTSDFDIHHHQRSDTEMPRSATNCTKFMSNLLLHIGGVPLNVIAPDRKNLPSETRSLETILHRLAESGGTSEQVVDFGEGMRAYAFRKSSPSFLDVATALPLHSDANGTIQPMAQYLLENSRVWYDPKLNAYDMRHDIGISP